MAEVDGVTKTKWGYELVWATTDDYCGKILVFENEGNKTEMILHTKKDKTWFVNQGQFIVRWIDTSNGCLYVTELKEGDTLQIQPLKPHQLETKSDNSSITEVSTSDQKNDTLIISN